MSAPKGMLTSAELKACHERVCMSCKCVVRYWVLRSYTHGNRLYWYPLCRTCVRNGLDWEEDDNEPV